MKNDIKVLLYRIIYDFNHKWTSGQQQDEEIDRYADEIMSYISDGVDEGFESGQNAVSIGMNMPYDPKRPQYPNPV